MLYSYQKIELMINKVNVFMCEIFHRSFLNKTKKTMEFLKLFEIRLLKTVTTTTTREKQMIVLRDKIDFRFMEIIEFSIFLG